MQTVFSNPMVAHVWAQQNQPRGRSNNGNMSFEGETLYSYSTPIAQIIDGKFALISARTYSVTTSGHISLARRAASHYKTFTVHDVWPVGKPGHKRNHDIMLRDYRAAIETAARRNAIRGWDLERSADDIAEYSQAFKLGRKAPHVPTYAELQARGIELRSAAAKKAAKTKRTRDKARIELAADIEAWRNGAGSDWDYPGRHLGLKPTPADKDTRYATQIQSAIADYRAGQGPAKPWVILDKLTDDDKAARETALAENLRAYLSGESDTPPGLELSETHEETRAAAVADRVEHWAQGAVADIPPGGRPSNEQRQRRYAIDIEAWRNGAATRLPHDAGFLLRIQGDKIQTSQGAEFPTGEAIRAFPFIQRCRDRKTVWQSNGQQIPLGYFRIDRIDDSGNVRAGCHLVTWLEIERVAQALGLV